MSKRLASETPKETRSWLGTGIVLLSAAFLLLTTNEGKPSEPQRLIDSVFHSFPLMVAATAVLWLARRDRFGVLPKAMRAVSTLVLPFFLLFTFFAFLSSPPIWGIDERLGMSSNRSVSIAIVIAVALFFVAAVGLGIRSFFRWLGSRYQQHGVAAGFGPIYFYFRKRRSK